jgi:hypothetical protein
MKKYLLLSVAVLALLLFGCDYILDSGSKKDVDFARKIIANGRHDGCDSAPTPEYCYMEYSRERANFCDKILVKDMRERCYRTSCGQPNGKCCNASENDISYGRDKCDRGYVCSTDWRICVSCGTKGRSACMTGADSYTCYDGRLEGTKCV